jgi:hypothetical protein
MFLEDEIKMSDEDSDVVVIEAPIKNEKELQEIRENTEGISEFAEKLGDRYEIRMKVDETILNYLTEIELVLPILDKIKFSELYLNLMKILGFYLLYIYIYTITSNNYIILICFIDTLVDYDLKRNTEVENCKANLVNGILGMRRDLNLQSLVFLHSYDDVREVFFG